MNFTQFAAPERQLSDVEAVQAPVQDNSSAMALSSIAQGVEQTGKSAFALKSTYDQQMAAEGKKQAAEQATLYSNRYDAAIEKYSAAVSSGELTKLQADTYLSIVKNELVSMGASADDLNKTEIAALKTLSGKALVEGSAQERADKKAEELFLASNMFNPYHTPQQQEKAKRDFFQMRNDNAVRQEKMENLSLEAAEFEKGTDEYNAKQREIKEEQIDALNNMLTKAPMLIKNEQAKIAAQYEADVISVGEAQAKLNAERSWNVFKNGATRQAELTANQVEGGLPVQKKAYLDMVERRSAFLDNLGDAKLIEQLEVLEKQDQTRLQLGLLNQDNTRLAKVVTDTFGGPEALTYFSELKSKAATSVNNFAVDSMEREDGGPAPQHDRQRELIKDSREMVKASISDFLEGGYEGDPRNLDKLVSGHLARLSEDFKILSTKEIDEALKYYSDPQFGRYVKQRGLSGQDLDNVNRQLHEYKARTAISFVNFTKENLGAPKQKAKLGSTGPRGKIAAARIPTQEDFDLVFEGGQVLIKAKNEVGRKKAGEMNDKAAGPLTRVVRTDANLSGQSEEQIFNTWKEQLWPSKDGEEQTQEQPNQEMSAQDIDWSQYEDGTYEGPDGILHTVTNGVLVEAGG